MKGLVLYRSFFGNTRRVAELLAEQLQNEGFKTDVRDVSDRPSNMEPYDFVFVGSPTRFHVFRGKGAPNGATRKVLKDLKRLHFDPKHPVVIYDTYGPASAEAVAKRSNLFEPGAAGTLLDVARTSGLNPYPMTLRCQVEEMKGPLKSGEEAKVRAFAHGFAATMAS